MSVIPTPAGVNLSDSRRPELYAATIVTYCLALLALGLRFLSRRLLKSGYGLDDFFAVAAMVCACLPSCRPILSLILTGSPTPSKRSGYSFSKRIALSLPVKASQAQSSNNRGVDGSSNVDDDQRLFVQLDEREGSASQNTPNSPTTHIGTGRPASANVLHGSKANSKKASWLSGKWSRERTASSKHDDVEMQPPVAPGNSINVRNDVDIRWTDSNLSSS